MHAVFENDVVLRTLINCLASSPFDGPFNYVGHHAPAALVALRMVCRRFMEHCEPVFWRKIILRGANLKEGVKFLRNRGHFVHYVVLCADSFTVDGETLQALPEIRPVAVVWTWRDRLLPMRSWRSCKESLLLLQAWKHSATELFLNAIPLRKHLPDLVDFKNVTALVLADYFPDCESDIPRLLRQLPDLQYLELHTDIRPHGLPSLTDCGSVLRNIRVLHVFRCSASIFTSLVDCRSLRDMWVTLQAAPTSGEWATAQRVLARNQALRRIEVTWLTGIPPSDLVGAERAIQGLFPSANVHIGFF